MIRKYVLPILAAFGLLSAIRIVFIGSSSAPPPIPIAQPAAPPFSSAVSGSGIVEASSENIAIGTSVAGIIQQITVAPGQIVEQNAALFIIDDREARSLLEVKQATVLLAKTDVKAALVLRDDAALQHRRVEEMQDQRAISKEERDKRRFAYLAAESKLSSAEAHLKTQEAELNRSKVDLERLTVRAPVKGKILRINMRVGEFAPTGIITEPLILMGNTDILHVRVDIDESDAWRIAENCKGVAFVRGNKEIKSTLTFARFEPYITPKKSLTGASTERTDTRVLQVIFSIDDRRMPVYVGQLLDVFVEGKEL